MNQQALDEIRLAYGSHADMQVMLREVDALRLKVEGQAMLLAAYRLGTRPPEKAFKMLTRAAAVLDEASQP